MFFFFSPPLQRQYIQMYSQLLVQRLGFRLQSCKNICALESPASHIFSKQHQKANCSFRMQWNSKNYLKGLPLTFVLLFFLPAGSIKCNQLMTVKSIYWESVSVVTNQFNKSHQTLFSPLCSKAGAPYICLIKSLAQLYGTSRDRRSPRWYTQFVVQGNIRFRDSRL